VLIIRRSNCIIQHLVSSLSVGDPPVRRLREDCVLSQPAHGQENIKTVALANGIYVVLCREPSSVVVRMCVKIVSSLFECVSPSDTSAPIMKHC